MKPRRLALGTSMDTQTQGQVPRRRAPTLTAPGRLPSQRGGWTSTSGSPSPSSRSTFSRPAARLICLQTSSRVIIPATIALGGGLQTGGWGSAVARSCGQIEMLLVQLFVVKGGCKEIRIDRLRQPAAQASRHLRLVQQRLLYFSRSPCALCLLLCGTSAGAGALPSCCFPRLCSLLCSLHCVLPPRFC